MSKVLDKIKKIASNEDYSWLDEARVRLRNKAWRKRSFQIAARILVEIRRQKPINGMTQKMLAEKMGVAPQYINKVVKGKENLTLETIAKFEEILGITLINITEPEVQYDLEIQDFADDQKISNYQEASDSSKGYFYKIFKFNQEDNFKYPIEDDSFIPYAKLNRNDLLGKVKAIGFALNKITTEQFAVIEDNFPQDENEIGIGINFRFTASKSQKMLGVFTTCTFQVEEKQFLVVEASCHFKIKPQDWENLLNNENNELTVPKGLLVHLATITVGTTRGILHAKTGNTSFSKYHLPIVNVGNIIEEGIVFKFDNKA